MLTLLVLSLAPLTPQNKIPTKIQMHPCITGSHRASHVSPTTAKPSKIFRSWSLNLYISEPFLSPSSNFAGETSQANLYGPLNQSEAAEVAVAAAAGPIPNPPSMSSSSSPPSSSTSAFCPILPSSRHIVERQPRMLNFRVEYRQQTAEVVLEEASTVGMYAMM